MQVSASEVMIPVIRFQLISGVIGPKVVSV